MLRRDFVKTAAAVLALGSSRVSLPAQGVEVISPGRVVGVMGPGKTFWCHIDVPLRSYGTISLAWTTDPSKTFEDRWNEEAFDLSPDTFLCYITSSQFGHRQGCSTRLNTPKLLETSVFCSNNRPFRFVLDASFPFVEVACFGSNPIEEEDYYA